MYDFYFSSYRILFSFFVFCCFRNNKYKALLSENSSYETCSQSIESEEKVWTMNEMSIFFYKNSP